MSVVSKNEELRFIKIVEKEQIKQMAGLAAEIWNEYFPPLISQAQTDYMVKNLQSEEAVAQNIKDGYEYYFITSGNGNEENERKNIGYFAVNCEMPKEPERVLVSKVYLHKDMRGRGYAGKVIRFIEDLSIDRGKKLLYLYVFRGNENSIAVYKKWGFKIVRNAETDIGGGFVLHDYEMEKVLE